MRYKMKFCRPILKRLLVMIGVLSALSWGLQMSRSGTKKYNRILLNPLSATPDSDVPEGAIPMESKEVEFVMEELMKTLTAAAGTKASNEDGDGPSMQDVDNSFAKLLSDIKGSTTLTESQKRVLTAETALTMSDAQEGDTNVMESADASKRKEKIGVDKVKTLVYSQEAAPYLVVHGPGPVGQGVFAFMKSLGRTVSATYIEADSLAVIQESELDYAVRDCRSIILAADSLPSSGKGGGFFGGAADSPFVVNEKAIKRLLNAAMKARNKASSDNKRNVKIVALAEAAKAPKSIASLLGGETFSLENEVILQCKKRQLDYAIIKVGRVVTDTDFAKNDRLRPAGRKSVPFTFTRSRVEPVEVTQRDVAVEALLRAASHPQTNSTVSVVSVDPVDRSFTDEEWDDEFCRIEGPELLRVPLKYASELQMGIKVGRIAKELQEPGSGLITPIEVERFSNGVRILFRPKASAYQSSKEERRSGEEAEAQAEAAAAAKAAEIKARGGYIRPEDISDEGPRPVEKKAVRPKRQQKKKMEGGLEVIVDSEPYRRVRVRRTNMGPDAVVKEESEAIILKALQQGIRNLEGFYDKMIKEGLDL
jgi:hypothetical protein